jgi:predicted Ser/Thr protein kinase
MTEKKAISSWDEREKLIVVLADNLRAKRAELEALLARINRDYEDLVYRFYHGSFKAFGMQEETQEIAAAFRSVAPEGRAFCWMFTELLAAGTGRKFTDETNGRWMEEVAPIAAAYLHARFLLEMATKVAADANPDCGTIGYPWATILSLFNLR